MKKDVFDSDYEDGLKRTFNFKVLHLELCKHKPTKRALNEQHRKHRVTFDKLTELHNNAAKVGDSFAQSTVFKNFLTAYKTAIISVKIENRTVPKKERSVLREIVFTEVANMGPVNPSLKLADINNYIVRQIEFRMFLSKMKLDPHQKSLLKKRTYKILSEISLVKHHHLFNLMLVAFPHKKKDSGLPTGNKPFKFNYETFEYERDLDCDSADSKK